MGVASTAFLEDTLKEDCMVLWLLKSFFSLFHDIPGGLGTRVRQQMYKWGWAADEYLFSVFWPIAFFCNDLVENHPKNGILYPYNLE